MGGITTITNKVKYIGIASLTIAIISILILNIISSYSLTNTTSKAEEVSNANTDPSAISLSFSNATGSCTDTSNPANICLSIPDSGGIATGGHTVTVNAPTDSDYELTVSSKDEATALVNGSNSIPTVTDSAGITSLTNLPDRTWGMSITSAANPNTGAIYGLRPNSSPLLIANTQSGTGLVPNGSSIVVQYGVNVQTPSSMPAGNYAASIVYTATAIVPPVSISRFILNDTVVAGYQKEFAVEGKKLATTTGIKLCRSNNTNECFSASNVRTYPGTSQADTLVSFTNPVLNTLGEYDVVAQTSSGEATLRNAFIVQEKSICRSGDVNNDCKVDIDANMIPVKWNGSQWVTIANPENNNNPGEWYDYSKKQWANAVTVTSNSLSRYKNRSNVAIDNDDVMGYWVYIPRYAYEVQRPNAVDRVVTDEYPLPDNVVNDDNNASARNSHAIVNELIIHFEKNADGVKNPATTCNNLNPTKQQMWKDGVPVEDAGMFDQSILAKDYRTECTIEKGISRDYTESSSNSTTWATHPAFAWGNTEMNGFWMGKFETTGKVNAPTVKPNQKCNVDEPIGTFYTAAKSIGVNDPNNTGGSTVSGIRQNSHNLSRYTSHMTRNNEWGATLYLASSVYGAGTNQIQPNASSTFPKNRDADNDLASVGGATGCGPTDNGGEKGYEDGVQLSASTIESANACSTTMARSYTSTIGQLASTTNNVYGIYDMVGGSDDMVAISWSDNNTATSTITDNMAKQASEPYVNLLTAQNGFDESPYPEWSASNSIYDGSMDKCTWQSCGGHATHETNSFQSDSDSTSDSTTWGDGYKMFMWGSGDWLSRGGYSWGGNHGMYSTQHVDDGDPSNSTTYRISIVAST